VKCDEDEMMEMDKGLCFRAEVNVLKPLRKGVMVKVDGKAIWIKFKYLKLPDFCYGCGVLVHTLKACEVIDPRPLQVNYNTGHGLEHPDEITPKKCQV